MTRKNSLRTQPNKIHLRFLLLIVGSFYLSSSMAANSLRMPMASSSSMYFIPCSSSSSSSKRRSFMRARAIGKIPMNPSKDPFLSKLASVAATSPHTLLDRPKNSDMPPFLDIFDSPTLMATPAQVERSVSYNEHRPRRPPPDLPSLLLHGRIVYIGMPVGGLTLLIVMAYILAVL